MSTLSLGLAEPSQHQRTLLLPMIFAKDEDTAALEQEWCGSTSRFYG